MDRAALQEEPPGGAPHGELRVGRPLGAEERLQVGDMDIGHGVHGDALYGGDSPGVAELRGGGAHERAARPVHPHGVSVELPCQGGGMQGTEFLVGEVDWQAEGVVDNPVAPGPSASLVKTMISA
ncbi:hypothetical protein [Streptomyces sp. NPDC001435]|uniref:hypothetical protein n=1 Tax=Streptomyces sp. NPDC001435 TaxID=3364576 RepID=UPI0036BEB4EC